MTVEIRKNNAAKQTHTVNHGRAVIFDHGWRVKISIDVDYNRIGGVQITHAHTGIHELIDSALDTADALRASSSAIYEISDLDVPLPLDIDMGDHA